MTDRAPVAFACSFCGEHQVRQLVVGPGANICDRCAAQAHDYCTGEGHWAVRSWLRHLRHRAVCYAMATMQDIERRGAYYGDRFENWLLFSEWADALERTS